jgi:hypothetical protein
MERASEDERAAEIQRESQAERGTDSRASRDRGWFQPAFGTASASASDTATTPASQTIRGATSTAVAVTPASPTLPAASPSSPTASTGSPASPPASTTNPVSPASPSYLVSPGSPSRPSTSTASPAASPDGPVSPAKKTRSSRFGSAPSVRPDVLTDAETIVLPALESKRAKSANASNTRSGSTAAGAVSPPATEPGTADSRGHTRRRHSGEAVATSSRTSVEEAETQILPVMPAPPVRRHLPERAYQPLERYIPSRRTTRVSRTILLAILCLQAIMSLRLRNSAFEDEALYLYAGHLELGHLLHGAPLYGSFESYFSGSPVLYPVVAAALDQAGGLALARALSLVEMLAITTMCYSIARYLFNERIALCAAAIFSVTESTLFLGNFATFDASCLFLLAAAAWIMVYTARCRWPVLFLAAPLAALAVAVKYAGLLWVPAIAVLPILTVWPDRIRRVWFYSLGFLILVGGLLYTGLKLGGHAYVVAIKGTTTNRAHGGTPLATLLTESLKWGGLVFALAVVGSITYVIRVRTDPGEKIAPAGSRLRRAALGLVLTGTALLAPIYQIHLHTDISFQKHIGFGLFFAAPMAGFGLVRIMGAYFHWPHFGVAIWSLALVVGLTQSNDLYHGWPQTDTFVHEFTRYLKPNAQYLVEVPEIPIYYLENRSDAKPAQFTATYSIPPLTTPAKFAAAVKTGEFQVIAYNDDLTPANDAALATALKASHSYRLASKVYIGYAYGASPYYYIWVKSAVPKAKAKAHKATTRAPSSNG